MKEKQQLNKNMAKICTIDSGKIVDGTDLMNGNLNLKIWKSPLTSLKNGTRMFYACSEMTTFEAELPSLVDAPDMFYDCWLGSEATLMILNSIPDYTNDGETHRLYLTMKGAAAVQFLSLLGLMNNGPRPNENIEALNRTIFNYKGWAITGKWPAGAFDNGSSE
jgi:hypothetical protein